MKNKEMIKLLNRVWDNLQKGDTKESMGMLEKAIQRYPKDKWLALFSAEFYSIIGKETKAIQKLNTLLDKEPNFSEAWALLGEIYSKRNKFQKAIQAYEKAVNLKPSESSWLDSLVTLYFMGKKTKLAGKLLKNALKTNPADHWFRLLLALTHLFENRPKQAFSLVKNVLDEHPNVLSGKANLGLYALNLAGTSKLEDKQYTEAIHFFREALKINQNTYYNLAQCYLFERNFKSALKYTRLSISLDRHDYAYWELLGKIYLELYNWKKAVKAFKQAIYLGSDKLSTKISSCLALYYAGELEEAQEKATALLSQNPGDRYLLYLISCIYSRMNNLEKALGYLERALNNGFPLDQVDEGEFSTLSDNPRFISLVKPMRH